MEGYSNAESLEEFKNRLNSLTEKLNKTDKNMERATNKIKVVA